MTHTFYILSRRRILVTGSGWIPLIVYVLAQMKINGNRTRPTLEGFRKTSEQLFSFEQRKTDWKRIVDKCKSQWFQVASLPHVLMVLATHASTCCVSWKALKVGQVQPLAWIMKQTEDVEYCGQRWMSGFTWDDMWTELSVTCWQLPFDSTTGMYLGPPGISFHYWFKFKSKGFLLVLTLFHFLKKIG